MALAPAPASVSLNQVNVELSRASGASINMNDTALRTLAQVSTTSGASYSMNNFRGQSAYTPMTITKTDAYVEQETYSGSGTVYAYPSVSVTSGGSGGFTYAWAFTSNPNSMNLSASTSATATVSRSFTRYMETTFTAVLQCTVTDNTGHAVVVSSINVTAVVSGL